MNIFTGALDQLIRVKQMLCSFSLLINIFHIKDGWDIRLVKLFLGGKAVIKGIPHEELPLGKYR